CGGRRGPRGGSELKLLDERWPLRALTFRLTRHAFEAVWTDSVRCALSKPLAEVGAQERIWVDPVLAGSDAITPCAANEFARAGCAQRADERAQLGCPPVRSRRLRDGLMRAAQKLPVNLLHPGSVRSDCPRRDDLTPSLAPRPSSPPTAVIARAAEAEVASPGERTAHARPRGAAAIRR